MLVLCGASAVLAVRVVGAGGVCWVLGGGVVHPEMFRVYVAYKRMRANNTAPGSLTAVGQRRAEPEDAKYNAALCIVEFLEYSSSIWFTPMSL